MDIWKKNYTIIKIDDIQFGINRKHDAIRVNHNTDSYLRGFKCTWFYFTYNLSFLSTFKELATDLQLLRNEYFLILFLQMF